MSVWFSKPHGVWRYKFQYNGKPVSGDILRPDGTSPPERGGKREARQVEAAIKVAIRQDAKAAMAAPAGIYTLAEAAEARIASAKKRKVGGLRNIRMIRSRLRKILVYFGPATPISAIRKPEIGTFSTDLIEENKMVWKGGPRKATPETRAAGMKPLADPKKRSMSTANAILNELSATLRLAHKTEDKLTRRRLLAEMPVIERYGLPKRVPNPIPDEIIIKILDNAAPHLVDYLSLCRQFGFREQEAICLSRSWVRWQDGIIVIPAEHAKSGNDEILPIPDYASGFLRELYDEAEAAGQERLVLYTDPKDGKKRPVKGVRTAWEAACDRAGVSRFKKHGTRARFITALAECSAPEIVHKCSRHARYETSELYIDIAANLKRAAINSANPGAGAMAIAFRTKSRQKVAPNSSRNSEDGRDNAA